MTLQQAIQQFGNAIQINKKVYRMMPQSQQTIPGKVIFGYRIPSQTYKKDYELIQLSIEEAIEKVQQKITVKYF